MDKTLEVVITAAVLMMIAAVLFFMISQGSGDLADESNSQIDSSQCKIWKAQGQCDKASECSWTQSDCNEESSFGSSDSSPETSSSSESGSEDAAQLLDGSN